MIHFILLKRKKEFFFNYHYTGEKSGNIIEVIINRHRLFTGNLYQVIYIEDEKGNEGEKGEDE